MRRYLLRVRPGREWSLCVEAAPRQVYEQTHPAVEGWWAIPYVVVMPEKRMRSDGTGGWIGEHVWRERAHYAKAERDLVDLAREVAAANPSRWVDVLDVTGSEARIVCRLEPQALIVEPVQDSLL